MPTAGTQFSRYKIPANLDPAGICCITVPVPDDPEWIAQFNGAVYRMSIQSHYERDDAKSGKVVAARWREIWKEIQVACCSQDQSINNIQISAWMLQNFQMAFDWTQIWVTGTQTVSIDYYLIPDTYSTDAGDAGDEIFQREQALCLATQGWLNEVMNYMESWMISNFEEVALVAGGTFGAATAISGLLMFPVLVGWAVAANIAIDVFLELRRTEYRQYLVCRMFENLKGKNPDLRSDFNEALTADLVGRPQPEDALQDIARDLIEAYIRSQLNNLDNYLMFAGQLGTAMDIAKSGEIECPCTNFCHTFDFTIDEQGWSPYELNGLRAAYDAGVGWGNIDDTGDRRHLIQLNGPAFASTFITHVTVTIDLPLPGVVGQAFQLAMPNAGGAQYLDGIVPGPNTVEVFTVGVSGTGLWGGVNSGDQLLYTGHIVSIVVCGQGDDPF